MPEPIRPDLRARFEAIKRRSHRGAPVWIPRPPDHHAAGRNSCLAGGAKLFPWLFRNR